MSRRRRSALPLVALWAFTIAVGGVVVTDAVRSDAHPGFGPLALAPADALRGDPSEAPAAGAFPVFGEAGGTELRGPVARPVAVLFHEGSRGALAIRPRGDDHGVMRSRGRATPPTSAVDVVVRPDQQVYAPVSGTVVAVRPYRLYGRHHDIRVVIAPAEAPSVRVVVLHVARSGLVPGQTVVASLTPMGVARVLPFRSQADDYVAGRNPHVHLEVKRAS